MQVLLKANASTELVSADTLQAQQTTVVLARLIASNGDVLARTVDWPQPLKHLHFPSRSVHVKVECDRVLLSTDKPVKGIKLEAMCTDSDVLWDDVRFISIYK